MSHSMSAQSAMQQDRRSAAVHVGEVRRDGGTHLAGFRGALTRSIVNYINKNTKSANNISGEDAREDFECVAVSYNGMEAKEAACG